MFTRHPRLTLAFVRPWQLTVSSALFAIVPPLMASITELSDGVAALSSLDDGTEDSVSDGGSSPDSTPSSRGSTRRRLSSARRQSALLSKQHTAFNVCACV